ncbi:hypothetical protein BAU15_12060 [Enterococcus sp. JM4C]|nr:hypothetical protein BAU15_12060 [Enterococcus sp. JM4C]
METNNPILFRRSFTRYSRDVMMEDRDKGQLALDKVITQLNYIKSNETIYGFLLRIEMSTLTSPL